MSNRDFQHLLHLHDISQEELSRKIGVTVEEITEFAESSDFSKFPFLTRLCEYFEISPKYFTEKYVMPDTRYARDTVSKLGDEAEEFILFCKYLKYYGERLCQ